MSSSARSWMAYTQTPPTLSNSVSRTRPAQAPRSLLPRTAVTGASAASSSRMPAWPMSPPCTMWAQPPRNALASGLSRPCVSEMSPILMPTLSPTDSPEQSFDGQVVLQPHHRTRERRQPGLMHGATPHLRAAGVVPAGPLEELHVRPVKRSTRRDGVLTIAPDLPRPEAREANRRRNEQEHDQLELRRSEERRVGKECRSRWSPYH